MTRPQHAWWNSFQWKTTSPKVSLWENRFNIQISKTDYTVACNHQREDKYSSWSFTDIWSLGFFSQQLYRDDMKNSHSYHIQTCINYCTDIEPKAEVTWFSLRHPWLNPLPSVCIKELAKFGLFRWLLSCMIFLLQADFPDWEHCCLLIRKRKLLLKTRL